MRKEDYQKLVAVGIMTDGAFRSKPSRNTQLIEFYSNDHVLHLAFQSFMKLGFGRHKTSYYHHDKSRSHSRYFLVTGYELSKKDKIVKTLKELSPTYMTKRNDNPQPRVDFLLTEKRELQVLAVRFAMSCDGCVSVAHVKSETIRPSLKFACAHPSLVKEWEKLFQKIGIAARLDKDNSNWSGIHGLIANNRESIKKFRKMGGFYPISVKVQNGNYKGLPKNQVLNGICNWYKNRERNIDDIIFKEPWKSRWPHS